MKARLLAAIDKHVPEVDAVILSDYAKGVVSPSLAAWLIQKASALGKPVIVDPKGSDFAKYRGATVIKPNLNEAGHYLKRPVVCEADVTEAGRGLLAEGLQGVLITPRGGYDAVPERGQPCRHRSPSTRGLRRNRGRRHRGRDARGRPGRGHDLEQAARLANRAAGIVVGKAGTSTVSATDFS